MRRFSSLTAKKMEGVHEGVQGRGEETSASARRSMEPSSQGRGAYTSRLVALAVCIASIDTLSSGGIAFLLSSVFSFTVSDTTYDLTSRE